MRKNILIVSILCLLCITTSYTYSAFKNTIKGNITATSNKWKFSVNVPSGIVEEDYYKVPINNSSGSFNIVLDNTESEHIASYVITLEKIDLPNDFVINNSTYEGILNSESKTIKVTYSSSSSVNGYIKVKTEARKLEYAVMKNGEHMTLDSDENITDKQYTEFWNEDYRLYTKTITFSNDLSNLPSSCTESNLCWNITDTSETNSDKDVYGYLIDSGEKDSTDNTKSLYNLYIVSEVPIFAPSNCFSLFRDFTNLVNINFNDNFNTSNVENMRDLFINCSLLTNLDLSNFNTSNVTNMSDMFYNCSSLTELDLSSFNTSKVTNMNSIFMNCSSIINLNTSKFNTTNVTNMKQMFRGCSSLTSLDLSNFNTSKVTTMLAMFTDCKLLINLDVSSFNTSRVESMRDMFGNCYVLKTLDLSGFDTSNVTTMWHMFYNCYVLSTTIKISNPNVTSYDGMFWGAATDNAEIIVDYTDETSDLVDLMIATKSSNSNVHKMGGSNDTTPPTYSVSFSTNDSTSGVSGTITITDDVDGVSYKTFENLKSTTTYSISDNAGNTTSCTINVSSYTQNRSNSCSSYNTCADKYGCGTTKKCTGGYTYSGLVQTWGSSSECSSGKASGNYCNGAKEYSSRTCKSYTETAKTCQSANCGCASWGGWSGWSTDSCTGSNTKQCESRTVYKGTR